MLDVSATPYGKNHEQPNDNTPITMDDMKSFQSTYAVTYPLLFDQSVTQASVYGIQSYPTAYIVGQDEQQDRSPSIYPFTAQDITGALDKALAAGGS